MDITRDNLQLMKTSKGNDIASLSADRPVLLVFLRHFGCIFCRESLHDISRKWTNFQESGVTPVFVHMADDVTARQFFKKFGILDAEHISDPDCRYYRLFGLVKGSFSQLFGLKTWLRGAEVAATKGIFPAAPGLGDGLQMPGIFLIRNGQVIRSFIHHSVADKPDYDSFIATCRIN